MSFTESLAGVVASQLTRLAALNPHQLAGQVENLDFWLAQVRHALAVIDGYGVRFVRLHAAQERYVAAHGVTISEVGPAGVTVRSPRAVRRVPDRELRRARRELVESAARFLRRCSTEGLVADAVMSRVLTGFAESSHIEPAPTPDPSAE